MPDTDLFTGTFNRIKIDYGIAGLSQHRLTLLVGHVDGSVLSGINYVSDTIESGYDPTDPGGTPYTIVDWVNYVCFGLYRMLNDDVAIAGATLELLDHDFNVVGIGAITLDPASFATPDTAGAKAGMSGQYVLFQGHNHMGRPTRHMVGGVGAMANPHGDTYIAGTAYTTGSAAERTGDFLYRLNIARAMDDERNQHLSITSQADTDREIVPLAGFYSNIVHHGQMKSWVKFGY